MAVSTVETGTGEGYQATVDATGSLLAKPGPASVETDSVSVATTGTTIAAARPGRRQVDIQNLDAINPVHVRLEAAVATTGDLKLAPGARYSFPPSVSYEGEVRGIAVGSAVTVVVVEFFA